MDVYYWSNQDYEYPRDDSGDRIGCVRKGKKVSVVVDVKRCLIRGQNISLLDSLLPLDAPFIANGEVVMVIEMEK